MAGTAVAEKVVETPAVVDPADEFTDAFKMFSNPDADKPAAVTTEKAAEPDKPAAGAEATVDPAKIVSEIEGAPGVDDKTPQTDEEKAAAAEAAKKGDIKIAPPDAKDDKSSDVLERLVDILGQQKVQAGDTTTKAGTEAPLYSNQELTILAGFAKEWPEVAEAQTILLNGLAKSVKAEVYREIALGMAPHIRQLGVLINNAQYDDVERRVPGYEAVIPKVTEWANSQKVGYLKAAYTGVIEGGTPEEIEHLIGEWRKATGDTTGTTPATPVKAAEDQTLSPAAKKAAARLAPVVGKQSGAIAGEPQTFDAGFEQALKLLAG